MMRMEPRLIQSQRQQLVLTQKMQQAIHILQLTGTELEQYVQEELETNPVLDAAMKQEDYEPKGDDAPPKEENREAFEANFDLDAYRDQWDMRRREGRDLSANPELDDRRRHYEESITREESFTARLMTQLRLATEDPTTTAVGEAIISDIDARGYFNGDLEALAQEQEVSLELAARVLRLIQTFEPTGVGARNVVECLLLQVEAEFPHEPELATLVREHLGDLERRQIPKIAKAMRVTPERVEELKAMLATLDPWPGHGYASGPPQYITPDVVVEKNQEPYEYDVRLVNERIPELSLNKQYSQMVKQKKLDKDTRQFVRDKVEAARWLIRNIEQRQSTILRVAQAIVDVQRDFLDKGIEHIKPLTLQEIADVVGVHEATVSRTTRGKYMQTPQGLFELKFFFSPGLRTDNGEAQSSKSVQSLIKKIIDEENKRKPLSDQKIADMLKDQGINIARRTVTKYREAQGIAATPMRKSY